MSDVSNRYDPAPPPAATPPSPGPRRDDRVGADQGDAFQAALRDARGRDGDEDEAVQSRGGDRRAEDDKRKGRKGGAPGAASCPSGRLAEGLARFGQAHARAREPGEYSDMSGLPQHAGGLASAEAAAEPEAAGAVDPAAFAKMVDQAAAQAQAVTPGQTIRLEFTDIHAPLQGVEIQRAADGAISIALNASADQVTEVSRSLQALRRRLEARGLEVAEVTLGGEVDDVAPVRGGGALA